jgi:hypothetical protein
MEMLIVCIASKLKMNKQLVEKLKIYSTGWVRSEHG